MVDPRVADTDRSHRRGRGARWAPLLIVAALLAVGLAVAASVSSNQSTTPPDPEVRTARYVVGSCIAVTPGPVVVGVPCDGPRTGKVVATTDYPRPCPTGTETVSLVDEQLSICFSVP